MIAVLYFVIGYATHSPYAKYDSFRCSPIPRTASALMRFKILEGELYG